MNKVLILDKRFWPLFWTQFMGAFNDNVFKNALVILVTFKSYHLGVIGPEQMVALCGGLFILPFFLFSATAGQIADKFPKHKLMVLIKLWEILVMIIGGLGFYFESIELLLSSLFFMGLQSTFFGPIKYSILPEIIENEELVKGNALVEVGTFLSILLGTILGGVLIAVPENGKLYVSFFVIFFAIIGTIFSLFVEELEGKSRDKLNLNFFRANFEVLKITLAKRSVFSGVIAISWFWFLGAGILSIIPVYAKDILGGEESLVTFFLALFSIGVGLGSVLCEKISKGLIQLKLVIWGGIGMSLFLMDLFFIERPSGINADNLEAFMTGFVGIRITIDLLLFSVFAGFYIVPLYTMIQADTEIGKRSRVIAGNNILNAFFMVGVSILLMVLYGQGIQTFELFLIFSLANILFLLLLVKIYPSFYKKSRDLNIDIT